MDDKNVDTILAYGCRGVIVSILDELLKDAHEQASEREYIEMCLHIITLIRESAEEK